MSSLLLTGGAVATSLDPPVVLEADVLVEDARIAALGPEAGRTGAVRHDCSGCLIVPGNVCAHTHLYSALSRGMPYTLEPPATFLEILQRVWWRLDRALDEETIRASALLGGMEALLHGTTTLFDHHASPNAVDGSLDMIADALGGLGLRSVLCYETSDRDGPAVAAAGIDENRRFLERVRHERPRLQRGLVGAHASFTLSDETLAACVALGGGLHIHASEGPADEQDADSRFSLRVAERLALAGALGPETLLAHGVQFDESEAALVRAAGARLVHNARSNMNNGVGHAHDALLGQHVALGTDGIGADMFEEARTAFFRLREDDVEAGATWPLARLAESGRLAGSLFAEPLLGQIVPGAPADLVVLDYDAPTPLHSASLAGHWIFGLSSRWVRDVLVDGDWAVRDRRLACADQAELAASAREAARRLWKRLEEVTPHTFEAKGALRWPSPATVA